MLTPLNKATVGDPAQVGVVKSSVDLSHIVLTLVSRPAHVLELVEYEPELASTCDASAAGAGGIWIGHQIQSTVWRLEWPEDVVQLYRKGELTNSDLEMAGVPLQ